MSEAPDVSTPPADSIEGDPDVVLVERARDGDRAAMETLVLRYQAEIARMMWRFARSRADLDDLVQDTFLRVMRSLHTWRADKPFSHWLRRLTVNLGRDYCRRHAVRARWAVEPSREGADGEQILLEARDTTPDPAARAASGELKFFLSQLSPDDCALLTLHYFEDQGLQQIADDFGWTLTATKLRAFRARRRLKALFDKQPVSHESS